MAYRRSYSRRPASGGRRYGFAGTNRAGSRRAAPRRGSSTRGGGVMKLVIEHRAADPVSRPEFFGQKAPTGNGKAKL